MVIFLRGVKFVERNFSLVEFGMFLVIASESAFPWTNGGPS
jgi:hypothetical protein